MRLLQKLRNRNKQYFKISHDFEIKKTSLNKLKIQKTGKLESDILETIDTLKAYSITKKISFSYSVVYSQLSDEGILNIPLAFKMDEKSYSVFYIYSEDELSVLEDFKKRVKFTKYPNLIILNSLTNTSAKFSKSAVYDFQLSDLYWLEKIRYYGEYAMWNFCRNEDKYSNSKTSVLLNEIYSVTKNYSSYLFGYLVKQAEIGDMKTLNRIPLPEEPRIYVLKAPEDIDILLQVSQKKGFQFLFPSKKVDNKYRELFLDGVLKEFQNIEKELRRINIKADKDYKFANWFRMMSLQILKKEKDGGKIQSIESITIDRD
ncbi:MAG: hypothetical protein N4A49_14555 [Marinifilaceae bacterium]|nr:hypothetical protein [Marinifilaceae bacterium]